MGKKLINWKTKGMNRDMSVSAFSPEFAFENVNLRLATNEGNTMLSWVNEKGTKELTVSITRSPWETTASTSIEGTVIGTAVIEHQLVLFTHSDGVDRIYKLKYSNTAKTQMSGQLLYKGNLNFSISHPLETIVDNEADYIQKVYWTDEENQPRMINIADDALLTKWKNHTSNSEIDTFFDFIPGVNIQTLVVTISPKHNSGGTFAPGVIQYCLTYINKYGQQSNIVYCSSLYYLANNDRGASPEERVSSVFSIEASNLDDSFDYVRLYSIQRTSVNDTPIVKLLDDLPIDSSKKVVYTDNGTTGSIMDPTELLYVGGKEISVLTIDSKDGTLFMGNITQKNAIVDKIQEYIDGHKPEINFYNDNNKQITLGKNNNAYYHKNTLDNNSGKITTFKGGEKYRFGFQLQKRDGEWVDPIFIDDKTNELYPNGTVGSTTVKLISASSTIKISDIAAEYGNTFYNTFKKIRPVIVYPNINDRQVLCQGVLNPTVFNVADRKDGTPFAQPSWFFRPYCNDALKSGTYSSSSTTIATNTSVVSSFETSVIKSELVDNNFSPNFEYYVIVGYVPNNKLPDILTSGKLSYKKSSNAGTSTIEFEGAIQLQSGTYYSKYAFFRTGGYFPTNVSFEGSTLYYEDLSNVEFSSTHFEIYANLRKNSQGIFYYGGDSNSPESYVLKFFTDGKDYNDTVEEDTYNNVTLYTVTFTKVSDGQSVEVSTHSGAFLKFGHYQSIYSAAEAGTSSEALKQVEIQGSKNAYSNPFPSNASTELKSNTQFFIDQSIVTLNSPDLEFDNENQLCNMNGVGLRIVGMIPLTATASSHSIKASSAMLDTNYDSKNDTNKNTRKFGTGESSFNVVTKNISKEAYKRLIADTLWNDVKVTVTIEDSEERVVTSKNTLNYPIYPWQRTGPLNNDVRGKASASSFLQYKRMANLWFSSNSEYLVDSYSKLSGSKEISIAGVQVPLTENAEVMNYRLPQQNTNSPAINYYANIDKVLVNSEGYSVIPSVNSDSDKTTDAISMKYKSVTHAVIALSGTNILPEAKIADDTYLGRYSVEGDGAGATAAYWGNTGASFSQGTINISTFDSREYGFLWLGELYKTNISNQFGGNTASAKLANNWLPAGEAKSITGSGDITLEWTEGDTYYQRYDCLKTYPFTEDDTNQIVEILSFMCETHVNIDGRYDRNRGMMNNVNVRPRNFNLLNPVYSQRNNFFTYRKLDTEGRKELTYPNTICYSKTKQSGADVDMWANVTLASTLEMDGNKGSVNSIQRFNDQLIAFQDSGIAQILYNENVQIATTNGVPVELANSGKVQGKRYISNTVGCSNKWSIVQSPMGIYFMDSNDKSIYLFNGQLSNVSTAKGFNAWCKKNTPSSDVKWDPVDYNNFRAYYDKMNQDVLFVNKETALGYSEKVGNFTSFYDYGKAPFFENLDDTGVWVKDGKLWRHQNGKYCQFFGINKPYSMTLVGNQEPLMDKIFTNMEFRACVEGEGVMDDSGNYSPTIPFDSLEAWDEYQHGIIGLSLRASGSSLVKSSLERKFRIWRCDVPRDNYPLSVKKEDGSVDAEATAALLAEETAKGIKRFKVRPLDRMRNPWVYLKLSKKAVESGSLNKVEVHDVVGTYFG